MEIEEQMDLETRKVLSQREIDLLLGSLGAPDGQDVAQEAPPAKIVRPYDFRRPEKFSKEQLRALQKIHESFARMAASSLSSKLRMLVQLRLTSVEQILYSEYVQQLQNPTVVSIVSAKPLPERIIIEINARLAFSLVDRLLGGAGEVPQIIREATDIEVTLLQTLARGFLSSLREAWSQLISVTFTLDELVFDPQTIEAAPSGDIGILLLFELQIRESADTISMFIPYTMLEPVIPKLSPRMWLGGVSGNATAGNTEIRRQIERVEMPVTVSLGTATVSIRELLGLQKGDVIRLDTTADQELQVLVAGEHKFWSRPGRVGRRLAVVVTRLAPEESQKGPQLPDTVLAGTLK